MTLETLASYNYKKEKLLEEYRRFNRIHAKDIADLAEELELMGYPIDKIADKILRDLSDEIAKTVILKALPEKYLMVRIRGNMNGNNSNGNNDYNCYNENGIAYNNNHDNNSKGKKVLLTIADMQVTCEDLASMVKDLVAKLKNNPLLAEQLEYEQRVREELDAIMHNCKEIRAIIDDIKASKDQDMRAYIRELQELCIHLLSLTYSYRHIAKIFGISAKWVSKIVRERSIENLPSVYITLDRDVKKGEQIDILQYAIALYKKKSVIDESIE